MIILYFLSLFPLTLAIIYFINLRGIDIKSPILWGIIALVHGLYIKPLFLLSKLPGSETALMQIQYQIQIKDYWLLGIALNQYYFLIIFISIIMFAKKLRFSSITYERETRYIGYGHFSIVPLSIFIIFALIMEVFFFEKFEALFEVGSKNALAVENLSDYQGGGIYRSAIQFANFASLCCLYNINKLFEVKKSFFLLLISSTVWISYLFLSDQRGALIFSMIAYYAFYKSLGGTIPKLFSSIAIVIITFTVAAMTVNRISQYNLDAIPDALANLFGQNLIENAKSIRIMQLGPDYMGYQYGFTYLNSFLILVPREIFPGKSSVNIDTMIGQSLFDCRMYGACAVPPGLIGETFINFGALGLILSPVLFGYLFYKIEIFSISYKLSPFFRIFFFSEFIFFIIAVLGSSLSGEITESIVKFLTLGIIYFTCFNSKIEPPRVLPVALTPKGWGLR